MTLHNPLQELDNLHASEETKAKTLSYVMQKQAPKKHCWRKVAVVATCCICAFVLFLQPWAKGAKPTGDPSNAILSYVSFDVNPSMEWVLDETQHVVSVTYFNRDAEQLLKDMNLTKKPLQEALQILLKNEDYQRYLEEGILEVGVFSKDKEHSNVIEKEIVAYLEENLPRGSYHCAGIDEKTHESADLHHISSGKYRVIEQIMAYDTKVTLDQLKVMNMRELYQLLEPYDPSATPSNCGDGNGQGRKHHGNMQ